MAVASEDDEVLRYLRALGMPDNCVKFTVTAECKAPVIAEATFYVEIGEEEITKRYHLIEIEDGK
jgi:hypothetical protein